MRRRGVARSGQTIVDQIAAMHVGEINDRSERASRMHQPRGGHCADASTPGRALPKWLARASTTRETNEQEADRQRDDGRTRRAKRALRQAPIVLGNDAPGLRVRRKADFSATTANAPHTTISWLLLADLSRGLAGGQRGPLRALLHPAPSWLLVRRLVAALAVEVGGGRVEATQRRWQRMLPRSSARIWLVSHQGAAEIRGRCTPLDEPAIPNDRVPRFLDRLGGHGPIDTAPRRRVAVDVPGARLVE